MDWLDLFIIAPFIVLAIALEMRARRAGDDSTREWIDRHQGE